MKKPPIILLIYLSILSACTPFSTDIYLASMPIIQQQFHASAEGVELTLSLFFVSFAVMQLLWGPLSDRIGRKPVIFMGMGIFFIGSLLCVWSQSLWMLIVARIIQATGACSGAVIGMAVVKDRFDHGKTMARILANMMSVMILAPILAPIIGSYLLVHINWQANFYFLAIYALILFIGDCFLQESHPRTKRQPLPINKLCQAYWQQVSFQPFLLAALAVATNFGVMFAFISSSPFIYINLYHLPSHLFGYFFALNAAALIFSNLSIRILRDQLSEQGMLILGVLCCLLGALLMIVSLYHFPHVIWSVAIPSFIATYGVGFLFPEIMSHALRNVLVHTGLTSSLIGTIRFVLAAIVGLGMGMTIHQSPMPLAVMMLILSLFTAIFLLLYINKSAKNSNR